MNPENFISTARELIPTGQGKPRNTDLRRAVSTAYYAMFHCLAHSTLRLARISLIGNFPER